MASIKTIDMRHEDVPHLYDLVDQTPFAENVLAKHRRPMSDLERRVASAICYALLDSRAWMHRHSPDQPAFPADSYRFRWFVDEWPDTGPILDALYDIAGPFLLRSEPDRPPHPDGQRDLGYLLIPMVSQTTSPTTYVSPVRLIAYQNEQDLAWRHALVLDGFLPIAWTNSLPSYDAIDAIVNEADPPFEPPFTQKVTLNGRLVREDLERAITVITAAAINATGVDPSGEQRLEIILPLPRIYRDQYSSTDALLELDVPWDVEVHLGPWRSTIQKILSKARIVGAAYVVTDLNPHRRSGYTIEPGTVELAIPRNPSHDDISWARGYLADLAIPAPSFL